jgi:integrase
MAQHGFVFRKGRSWFLRYRHDLIVDGKQIRKQKCIKLADYCDRYRREGDLDELVAEKMAGVRQAAKCPKSGQMFTTYVEETYLPYAKRTCKPSTYAGRETYWEHYIKPRVAKYALRDFTTAIVYGLLDDVARTHSVNVGSVAKLRAVLYGIFQYAINTGDLPGGNPTEGVILPESATKTKPTVAATREEVQATLTALKGKPVARAAVAIMAFTGVRPGEARGLRWEEWDRTEQHIHVRRSIWHREEGEPKTQASVRFVTVTDELRGILLDLWNVKNCPMGAFIFAGRKGQPINLDNMARRVVRPELKEAKIEWHGWYALRRFHGTQVRMHADSETSAKALGNSKAVADKHYIKPQTVLPDVRKAVNSAVSGLVN